MIILASGSPRRKELISKLPAQYRILVPHTKEQHLENESPWDMVSRLAAEKAVAGSQMTEESDVVIGADTTVSLSGKIFGKPKDEADAFRMLRLLSGNTHEVYTGVCVLCRKAQYQKVFYEKTKVTFVPMTDDEILAYLRSGEPMDKAGAYGIQELGSLWIQGIEGDYFNVVGLPISRLYQLLKKDFPDLFSKR